MKKLSRSKAVLILALLSLSVVLFSFYVKKHDKEKVSVSVTNYQDDTGMTVADFQKRVSNKTKLVLVYFNASWCVPCIKLKPEIAALEIDTKDYCEVLKLDADDNPKLSENFEINTLPMFMLYKNGKKVWETTGFLSKIELQAKIEVFRK